MIIKVFTISNRLNVAFSQHVLIFILIVLKCIVGNYTDQFNYGLLLFLTAVISCLLFHVSKYELYPGNMPEPHQEHLKYIIYQTYLKLVTLI